MRDRGAAAIDVRPEVEAASDRERAGALRGHGVDALRLLVPRRPDGRIVANWPGYMREYFERTRELDPAEFELLERAA